MSIVGPLDPLLLGRLGAGDAVARFRELLHCEARYAGLGPNAVTISSREGLPDGGIDAQVDAHERVPQDGFLQPGRTGYQIKTGTTFRPWQPSSIEKELLVAGDTLAPEVERTLQQGGRYSLVCFGIDLTPEQRNDSIVVVRDLLRRFGFAAAPVEVLGQSQIAAYIERYPSVRLAVSGDRGADGDFLTVAEWAQHAHMQTELALSEEQQQVIEHISDQLRGGARHIRLLGEPGVGKTRLVLEAVRPVDIAPSVVYVEHGHNFARTQLFRSLLKGDSRYPLLLVLDELSESEMSEVWGHLKPRTGTLKLVSIDHGPGRSHDADIETISAPRLSDSTIEAILQGHVGKGKDLSRWVSACEGSPRVAQAVGENLAANPSDILRPPATVPLWERFLFGYASRDSEQGKEIERAMRHMALFARFGFESPVSEEAKYIAQLCEKADPRITWPRFQEIVQSMRGRRVLQGARTLFIVPWALHIYLWREYWRWYGRSFDVAQLLGGMPASLHGWFMEMFRYAHGSEALAVVREILRPDGIYSDRTFLRSSPGASFLSILAEADPASTLKLLEQTVGTWTNEELLEFKTSRQTIVWTLEKIAVWRETFPGAVRLLAKMARNENASNSNNSTGMLLAMFRIGPEWAATELSPEERLPIFEEMLCSPDDALKRIGLEMAKAALDSSGGGYRIVGAEHQGLRASAQLWAPATYEDWRRAYLSYWEALLRLTATWNGTLAEGACTAILQVAAEQIRIPQHRDMVLDVVETLSRRPNHNAKDLLEFFAEVRRRTEEDDRNLAFAVRRMEGRYVRRSIESRFDRYVLYLSWNDWHFFKEDQLQESTRTKRLIRALAARVVGDRQFDHVKSRLHQRGAGTGALFLFGEALCDADQQFSLLRELIAADTHTDGGQCVAGYFSGLRSRDFDRWKSELLSMFQSAGSAGLAARIVWGSDVDSDVLKAWLQAFDQRWVPPHSFQCFCYGRSWERLSSDLNGDLLVRLWNSLDPDALGVLIDLLAQVLKADVWPVDEAFVFGAVTHPLNFQRQRGTMHGHHWRTVCKSLLDRFPSKGAALLDALLTHMQEAYALSYDRDFEELSHSICKSQPDASWEVVAKHLLSVAPMWRGDILNWLKGGAAGFEDKASVPPIAEFPLQKVLSWIEANPESRASMIAHCAPRTLDDSHGGALTKALLSNYGQIDGVHSGIASIFHSGGWSGPESSYLRRRRERFRTWLGQSFSASVTSWIEAEIQALDRRIEAAEISEERESWARPH